MATIQPRITLALLEQTLRRVKDINPADWIKAVGLDWGAEQLLRQSAITSDLLGHDPGAIRLAGFQLGYEIAKQTYETKGA